MFGRNFLSGLVLFGILGTSFLFPRGESPTHEPTYQITTTTFEAAFATSSETCTTTIDMVQKGLQKGDEAAVYSSVETFHETAKSIQATVTLPDFDSHLAVTYSATVAEVVGTYSKVVTTLRDHPSVEKGCHRKLKEINVSVQNIVYAYAELGIRLQELVEKNAAIDNATLATLDLQLDFGSINTEKSKAFKVEGDSPQHIEDNEEEEKAETPREGKKHDQEDEEFGKKAQTHEEDEEAMKTINQVQEDNESRESGEPHYAGEYDE